eukprot:7310974-Karenia_brevis.AAC.1
MQSEGAGVGCQMLFHVQSLETVKTSATLVRSRESTDFANFAKWKNKCMRCQRPPCEACGAKIMEPPNPKAT